jgi:glucose-6-phosphate dehydrogenase assembly protein OpcA
MQNVCSSTGSSTESDFLAGSWLLGRMSWVSRRVSPEASGEQKVQVVLAVLAGIPESTHAVGLPGSMTATDQGHLADASGR